MPGRTRIAINGKFLSAMPTGVHRVAAELAIALGAIARERDDLEVELLVPRDAVARAAELGLPTRVLGPLVGIPWEQLRLPLLARDRILLNLCNIGPVARFGAFTMIHDAQVHLTPQSYAPWFRRWYKLVQPLLGRGNQHILTVSAFSREQIAAARICPIDRITVVHNGVDHILRAAPERDVIDRLGIANKRYVVGLASLHAHKNMALLLEAFRSETLRDITLVLVGDDGPEAFAARGQVVPPSVLFAGRVSDAGLRALYESALCLAFPSRTEGFGLPPLEAMLVGCAVVVAPCGALPEVCGDAALYGNPDRPDQWIALFRALADEPALRDRHVIAGRAHARAFTWRTSAERLLDAIGVAHLPGPGLDGRRDVSRTTSFPLSRG